MDSVVLDTTIASLLHPRRRGSPLRARYEPDMKQVGTNLRLLIGGEDTIYFLELEMASGHGVRERVLY